MITNFDQLTEEIARKEVASRNGFVCGISAGSIHVKGLATHASIGDVVQFGRSNNPAGFAEVVAISTTDAILSPFDARVFPSIGDVATLVPDFVLRPNKQWIGRVVDAFGLPLDGLPLLPGSVAVSLRNDPPKASERRKLDYRLSTKLAVMDTVLPIAKGQRIGVFAGSGVGKTSLLAQLAKNIEADCIVICLVGERGRELNEFLEIGLGKEGLERSVVVAATSDQSSLVKRRAAWTATSIAEYFRDEGRHVLLIVDSITRFAEAHREVALMGGETPSLRAFPPSTSNMIASLTERAGGGGPGQGDITAIYSVLVAGADMDEPVADMTRGLLDGHLVLDRSIAERGRFPAIDVRRSVSRSLPGIATDEENELIAKVRRILNSYETAAPLIQTGLYVAGSDPEIDNAISLWPMLDEFIKTNGVVDVKSSFELLSKILVTEGA